MSDDSNTVVIEALKEEINILRVELDELREKVVVLECQNEAGNRSHRGDR